MLVQAVLRPSRSLQRVSLSSTKSAQRCIATSPRPSLLSMPTHSRLVFSSSSARFQPWMSATVVAAQTMRFSPQRRFFHLSPPIYKKGTEAIRKARAATQPPPPVVMKKGVLFLKDRATFFKVLTGIVVLQFVFFVGAAQFYWQYDITLVDGMNSGSDFFSRLLWPAFFTATGTFLPLTRYFFGRRYVNKLELLEGDNVAISTYDFWGRSQTAITVPVKTFKARSYNDVGDYYKFRLAGYRWWFIMDKDGHIPDGNALTSVLSGKLPEVRY